jgi:hypothetical protein
MKLTVRRVGNSRGIILPKDPLEAWAVQSEDDGELFSVMLGREDNAVRLRQSMPFVGLLPQEEVGK